MPLLTMAAGFGLWVLILALANDRRHADARLREMRGETAARAVAEQAVRALPRRMAAPDALALAEPDERFAVLDGRLVVPPDLGSLTPTNEPDPRAELDPLTAEALRRAEAAPPEDRAASILGFVSSEALLSPALRGTCLARAAWEASRADQPPRRDEALARLAELATSPPEPRLSALLLRLRDGLDSPPGNLDADLIRLPEDRARAWLDRLVAAGLPAPRAAVARRAIDSATARRTTHRAVEALAPVLARAPRFVARRDGPALVLFDPSTGEGARLSASRAAAIATELLGTPIRAAALGDAEAPAAFDGLLEAPIPDATLAERPFDLLDNLALPLAALFFASLWQTWSSIRRETRALRLQTEFLTTVTHELKTPLAGIRLAAELLLDDHVTDETARRDWLRRLDGEAARLGMLVENVLDLGRTEKGERVFDPREVDLAAVVRDTLDLFTPLAERDGLEVRRSLPDEPIFVRAQSESLRQALLNVLDNARKYALDGRVLEVSLTTDGHEAVVTLRDHGPGIPAAERERIFSRFRRGSSHEAGDVPGVGLGLHLARVIAEQHSGSLRAFAPEDGAAGAAFVLRIPLVEAWERWE